LLGFDKKESDDILRLPTMKKIIILSWLLLAIPIFSLTIYYNGSLFAIKKQEKSSKETETQKQELKTEKEISPTVLAAKDTPNNPSPASSSINSETQTAIPEFQPSPIIQAPPRPITPLPTPETKVVYLNIHGLGNYQVDLEENDTAFTVLLRASQKNNFSISYQNYNSLGAFVKCIANICQDKDHYWAFYYNGKYSIIGASSLKVYHNDSTAWKLKSD